jgi:hypothetical protein
MIEYFTLDNLLLWFMISILITIIWSLCMGDPDSSYTGNLILTWICAILALPITLIFGLIILGIYIGIKIDNPIKKKRRRKSKRR